MDVVYFALFCFVGVIVASFSASQIILTIKYGIPIEKSLKKHQKIYTNKIKISNATTIIIHFITATLITTAIFLFSASNMIVGYVTGLFCTLFFGRSKFSQNEENIQDYLESNKSTINREYDEIIAYRQQTKAKKEAEKQLNYETISVNKELLR